MERINKFRDLLSKNKIDNYFVANISNILYLTGYTGSTAYLLLTKDKNILISDGRYETQIAQEVIGDFEIHIVSDYSKIFKELTESLKEIYIDKNSSLYLYHELSSFSNIKVDDDLLIESLRRVKDNNEILEIKKSYEIAGNAFIQMLKEVKYGLSENEWAAKLEYNMKILGAKATSFDTIVASGVRGALPHGIASDKIINEDEPIIIDYGCKISYCSDITRVVYSGDDNEVNEIISIVDEARQLAIDAIKPGVKCSDIDLIARSYIEKAGYSDYFNHGLGHSLGIDVHENPRFSIKDETILQEGMVLTVEPGIYLPNKFGIRLEDTILVTEKGCEILSAVLDKRVYSI